jgi:inorganic pyrophosphatase
LHKGFEPCAKIHRYFGHKRQTGIASERCDGDPLDVLILCDDGTFPGCEVECRLIGMLKAEQTEKGKTKRNDRLIAVATASVLYGSIAELSDLEPAVLKQVEEFFVNYQKVRDINFEILKREGSRSARKLVSAASTKQAA